STGAVTLTASLSGGKAYYVKVTSPTGSVLVYNLSIAKGAGALALPRYDPSFDDVIGDGTDALATGVAPPPAAVTSHAVPSRPPVGAGPGPGCCTRAALGGRPAAGMLTLAPSSEWRGIGAPTWTLPRSWAVAEPASALGGEGRRSAVPDVTQPRPADDGFRSD